MNVPITGWAQGAWLRDKEYRPLTWPEIIALHAGDVDEAMAGLAAQMREASAVLSEFAWRERRSRLLHPGHRSTHRRRKHGRAS